MTDDKTTLDKVIAFNAKVDDLVINAEWSGSDLAYMNAGNDIAPAIVEQRKKDVDTLLDEIKEEAAAIMIQECRMRRTLETIAQWDMLNPADNTKLADADWLKTLVNDALKGNK